ncbi:efflux RND transporter periplasmic adaptor subunit [Vibrio sp. HA2012]|uniref:efflux RND transporter periplasmic adaptor subunit n=1 Tax=Vibrio sp. HA2012 TaxID=1971595 RepID=UPI000C2B574D|nr:efflux RND transporter periplasmic adaptor subunit [Vibrio sp. HA2012]PJC86639.1 efflux RND transporter periplasmic adaptor subunit [Vibrio sp. HA2012]
MGSNRIKLLVVITMVLGMVQGCKGNSETRSRKPLEVSTYKIEKPLENQYRNFKGTVIPADMTPLSFRVEGELDIIPVRTGQKVKKGDLLAHLDDRKLRQQLADAEAQYELAVKQYQRGKGLLGKKMLSQSEMDELTANKRIAEVSYKVARNNLSYTRLVAPFNGYVSEVPKKSFESVNSGETVVSIYRDDVVRVRVGISDTVLATINPSSELRDFRIKTTFSGDKNSYFLNYYEHSSEPVASSNAFEFLLQMPQVETPILPGTSASLDVDMLATGLSTVTGYLVPMTALNPGRNAGEFYVWKLKDDRVEKVVVHVVKVTNEGAVINRGVKQGDILVNSGLSQMRDDVVIVTVEKESKL